MDEQQLKDVTAYAEAFMSPEEVGKILQLPQELLTSEEFLQAYDAGYLKAKYLVQKSTIDLAQAGSSPAQTIATKMMDKVEQNLILNG